MRGARGLAVLLDVVGGIIPAYAGSTVGSAMLTSMSRDHPRVCGEHSDILLSVVAMLGSSPRMRGARKFGDDIDESYGIIPAYAGSTAFALHQHLHLQDHPRVCGEHLEYKVYGTVVAGSSPRMRGARDAAAPAHLGCGIIPAYAGSTS